MLSKATGQGQHFQAQGHSFSLYGPTLSRQITCLFFFLCSKLVLQITNGFVYAAVVIQWACGCLPTICKKSWQRTSSSDIVDKGKMY